MANRRGRWTAALLLCLAAAACAFTAAVTIGSHHVSLVRVWQGLSPDHEVFRELRLPRAILAFWTGGALALAGVLFQTLLRNPLASPYTIGVSGGASLGAVVAIVCGWSGVAGLSAVSLSSCAGSALVLLLIVAIASTRGKVSATGLLLAGVTINSTCGAVIMFLSNLVGFSKSFAVTRWLMGGIDAPEYSTLLWLTVFLTPVSLLVFWYSREWNLMAVGDTWAATRGLSTARLMLIGCVAGSMLTGLVTALTGPIGFVGLIIPHILRLWVGADHRILAPCSFLLGAAFLALCDVLSRTVLAPVEIPVGVITDLLGGPFFLWMLNSNRKVIAL